MELVELGGSGLRVSRVGLGCNNFGGRLDLAATRAVVDAALDVGGHVLGHCGELRRGRRERALPRRDPGGSSRPGRARDEVRVGQRDGRRVGGGRPQGDRRLARAASNRPRRPLLPAQARSLDPDCGDARRARRARPSGQGARDRLLELLRGAPRRSRSRRAGARHGALHGPPEPLQPARAARRLRCASALSRARRRVHPVLPARERAADREVQARRARTGGNEAGGARDRGGAVRSGRGARPPSQRNAVTRCTSSRSPASRRPPASARSSRARRNRSRCERTRPRRPGGCPPTRSTRSPDSEARGRAEGPDPVARQSLPLSWSLEESESTFVETTENDLSSCTSTWRPPASVTSTS